MTEHADDTSLEEGYRADLAQGAIHDLDEGQHAVAVDFPYEVLDGYRTDWARGCWDESFNRRLPVMLANHDPNSLIGTGIRSENMGDRARLIGRFADFDDVPKARETFALVRDGIYPGWSFHYRNGRTIAHPSVRGARRYVKADMPEFSPVTFPSIPGAVSVGIRSQEATVDIPTIEEIFALQDRGVLAEGGVRALIAEHHPHYREHIRVAVPAEPTAGEKVAGLLGDAHGLRDLVIRIGSDGAVTTDTADPPAGDGGDDEEDGGDDPATLAGAVDAALDEACRLLEGQDLTGLPDPVQQAAALVQAAGIAVDELLDVLGVSDPDDAGSDDMGGRARLSSKEMDDAPDSAFAHIEPGGTTDDDGKTVPRSHRHFYIGDAAHVRNALARIGQGAEFSKEALPKVKAAAKKFGVDTDTKSGGRSAEPPDSEGGAGGPGGPGGDVGLAATLERLGKY